MVSPGFNYCVHSQHCSKTSVRLPVKGNYGFVVSIVAQACLNPSVSWQNQNVLPATSLKVTLLAGQSTPSFCLRITASKPTPVTSNLNSGSSWTTASRRPWVDTQFSLFASTPAHFAHAHEGDKGKNTRSRTPTMARTVPVCQNSPSHAQRCTHACQMVSTPAQAHPRSAAHTPAKWQSSSAPAQRRTHACQMASTPRPRSAAHIKCARAALRTPTANTPRGCEPSRPAIPPSDIAAH